MKITDKSGSVLAIGCFDVGKISELSINVVSDSVALIFSYDENALEHLNGEEKILKSRGMFAQISRNADVAMWGMKESGEVVNIEFDKEEEKRLLGSVVWFYGRIHAPLTREMHKHIKRTAVAKKVRVTAENR